MTIGERRPSAPEFEETTLAVQRGEAPNFEGIFAPKPEPLMFQAAASAHVPEVVLYEHADYAGAEWRTNLSYSFVGSAWNDRISSIIVVSGLWEFCQDINFGGARKVLGPGYYRFVTDVGIPNDTISSFRAVGA